MGPAKKMLDICFDFIVWISACFFLISCFSKISTMQQNLLFGLSHPDVLLFEGEENYTVSGYSIVAQLAGENKISKLIVKPLGVASTEYLNNFWLSVEDGLISYTKNYLVERELDEDGKVIVTVIEQY